MYRVMLRDVPEDVPIIITEQPEDLLVTSGEKVTFTITAEGSGLSYVWYYRKVTASAWSAWPQKDSNELTVTSNDTWDGMQVYCLITDEDGNTLASSACVITLDGSSAASITDQTDKVTAAAGNEVTLFVDVDTGTTYQWYYAADGDISWTKWSGYASASITVTMQSDWDGMRAYCLIASSSGYTTSNAILFTLASAVIHEPSTDPAEPHLYSCTLAEGASGEIDSVEFAILPNNPGYELLTSRTTLVEIYDTKKGKGAFSGRVLTVTPEMQDSGLIFKSVVCESRLGYLCDSIQPYAEEATYALEDFFKLLLANHNAQVEGYKKIYPGTITASASASTGNVTKGLNYQTTWEALSDKLLSTEGGEIELRETDGMLYLDYVDELGGQIDTVAIELGVNMRSIAREIDPTGVITRLIPLGAKLEDSEGNETEERLTIASVNDGVIYLDDETSQKTYGIVVGTVEWDDVTEASNLLTKGTQWLQQQSVTDKITLTAYDLSLIGLASDAIERYNYYQVVNSAIGTNRYFRVVKRTIDICNPANTTYEMGERSRSLGATIISTQKQAESEADERAAAIERLANKLASSSGLYMTTEEQDDGSYIYYMHNKPTLAESDIVWKLTAEAFGISLDGGQTYPYGFTVTGEMVMALIYAEGINADYINSGTLLVKDSEGNVMFSANVDTGEVTIDAASLTIKGFPTLVSATTYYTLSSSAEELDDDVDWAQDVPTRASGTYIWSKIVYVYSDSTKTETTPICISGLDGENGTGITSTSITYQVSANGTTPPTGEWSNSIPSVSQGEYLWTRTVWTYSDGTAETMYSVSYTGTDGEDGTSVNILGTAYTAESEYTAGKIYTLYSDSELTTKITGAAAGDAYLVNGYLFVYSETDGAFVCTGVIRGEDGTGITSVVNYYLASSKSSGVTTDTAGWTTGIQTVDATNKYLWNYEATTLTDGNTDITEPCIIGMYSEDGVGIEDVIEYYAVSTSNSTAPSSWSTSIQTMDATNRYLWNYEKIVYTNGTTKETDPCVIGVYGDSGKDGADGKDGANGTDGADGQMLYATCETEASAYVKVATLSSGSITSLKSGVTVAVTFTYANTASAPALNIGGSGTRIITVYGSPLTGTSIYNWVAGSTVQFVYDGTYWVMTETSALYAVGRWCYDNDTTYIDGGKLYTGTVAAEKLAVTELSAITGNVGTLTAGIIQSAKYSDTTGLQIDLNNGTITSPYFDLSSSGAEFTGKVVSSYGDYKTVIDSGTASFYYSDGLAAVMTHVASTAASQFAILAQSDYDGIALGYVDSSGTISTYYRMNVNDGYTSEGYRHAFDGTVKMNGALAVSEISTSLTVDGSLYTKGYIYASKELYFSGGVGDGKERIYFLTSNTYIRSAGSDDDGYSLLINNGHGSIVSFGYGGGTATRFYHDVTVVGELALSSNLSLANNYGIMLNGVWALRYYSGVIALGASVESIKFYGSGIDLNTVPITSVIYANKMLYLNGGDSSTESIYFAACNSLLRTSGSSSSGYSLNIANGYGTLVAFGYSSSTATRFYYDVTVVGTLTNSSDERKKQNIVALSEDERYSKMFDNWVPVSYEMISAPGKVRTGFTTQGIIEAMEAAGLERDDFAGVVDVLDDDGETYGALSYTDLIAPLVMEVQKLKKQVAMLMAG